MSLKLPKTSYVFEPEAMTYDLCRDLLASGVVGRVAVVTPAGLRIFPVNYLVEDEAVLFRTSPSSQLGLSAPGSVLAFEVDQFDYHYHRAWSVLAVGLVSEVKCIADLTALPGPWASGERDMFLRLVWDELTGRRLGPQWDPRPELAVRRVSTMTHSV